MADRKSGPVKPPVIDLTARDAGSGKRAKAAGAPAATEVAAEEVVGSGTEFVTEHPKPEAAPRAAAQTPPPPRPPARLAMPWSAISIAAAGGALAGTGLTYLLAAWIALPSSAPRYPDPAPLLAEQAARIDGLEQRAAAVEETALSTRVGLDATVAQLDAGLAELRAAIAALPAPAEVDFAPLEAQLRTLEGRIDAIGAGAAPADAGALAESLVALEQGLAALTGRLDAAEAAVAGLETRATAPTAPGVAPAADLTPAIRLPLVLSGLEAALAAGRPYAAELDALGTILPGLEVPGTVAAAADTGLARPDDLAARFAAAVPDILAARLRAPSGDWARDALDWARALLALRPAGEIEGSGPEAVMSRLEAAVARRDFAAAAGLLAQLPEPMRRAAGGLAAEIEAQAGAAAFVAALRAEALAPAAAEATP